MSELVSLPLPLQLFSLFLMALERANKREIELSGLTALPLSSLGRRFIHSHFIAAVVFFSSISLQKRKTSRSHFVSFISLSFN